MGKCFLDVYYIYIDKKPKCIAICMTLHIYCLKKLMIEKLRLIVGCKIVINDTRYKITTLFLRQNLFKGVVWSVRFYNKHLKFGKLLPLVKELCCTAYYMLILLWIGYVTYVANLDRKTLCMIYVIKSD